MDRRRWPLVVLFVGIICHAAAADSPAAPAADPSAAAKPSEAPKADGTAPAKPGVTQAEMDKAEAAKSAHAKSAAGGTDAVVLDAASLAAISGRSVKSPTGEDMGRIVDMLVTASGQTRAAVIDFGGFLGVGSRKIAVGWNALNFADLGKSGNVIVALTRNQLRMAPEFKEGDPIVVLEATAPVEAKAAPAPPSSKAEAQQKNSITPAAPGGPVPANPDPGGPHAN